MRITFIAQSVDNRTGIGRVVLNLAREFVRSDHVPSIVAQQTEDIPSEVTVKHVASFPMLSALNKLCFRLDSTTQIESAQSDVTIAFGVGHKADIVVAGSCHKAGMEIRKKFRTNLRWRRNAGLYDGISLQDEKRLLTGSRTRRIVAVSNLVKNQITQYYAVQRKKIVVIPNGVAPDWFESIKKDGFRASFGFKEEDTVILFAGNEFDRKGLETVINALTHLPSHCRLLVLGDDDSSFYAKKARQLNVSERVTFIGSQPDPRSAFAAADILVLPSVYEPFGMVIPEAMAAGVPIIVSKMCGAVEGLEHGEHGFFLHDPLSSDELTKYVRVLMENDALKQRIVGNARSRVRELLWENVANQFLNLCEEVLQERNGMRD